MGTKFLEARPRPQQYVKQLPIRLCFVGFGLWVILLHTLGDQVVILDSLVKVWHLGCGRRAKLVGEDGPRHRLLEQHAVLGFGSSGFWGSEVLD